MNTMSGVIEEEDRILGDQLSPAAREMYYQQAALLQQERATLGKTAQRVAYTIAGCGVVIGLAGVICAATLFPLKTREVQYFQVNETTGYVGQSFGAKDAPTLFSAQVTQAALQSYVEQREGYIYQTDPIAFHRVSIMSSPEEQARFKAAHDDATAPSRALRDRGYVQVENFQFFSVGDGRESTKQYIVKFDRTVMRSGDPVPTHGEPCTAEISFQFHPEYPMALPDRRVNPWGLQVLAYSAHPDDPSRRTR
jgi:type IV secretion system protein VirB8